MTDGEPGCLCADGVGRSGTCCDQFETRHIGRLDGVTVSGEHEQRQNISGADPDALNRVHNIKQIGSWLLQQGEQQKLLFRTVVLGGAESHAEPVWRTLKER